jgi:NAD(P)-dependent dehydrogenase (short-subunit alcohol dehydrogenase family)
LERNLINNENCFEILKKYGKIDGLVNNAANNPKVENSKDVNFSRLENFPVDIWEKDLDVALKGTFLCTKYYRFAISKNIDGGSIINISSDLGLIAPDQRL